MLGEAPLTASSSSSSSSSKFLFPFVCLAGIGLVWWLQPWALYYLLKKQRDHRLVTALYVCLYMTITGALGHSLHASLAAAGVAVKPMLFIVVWYTSAMQCLRFLHLLSVGPSAFARHFGLNSWTRIRLFMWSAPTIQFLPDAAAAKKKKDVPPGLYIHHSASSRLSWSHFQSECQSALLDILGMEVICAIVVLLELSDRLPMLVQAWIRVYIMGFSTGVLKLLVECSAYYWVLLHTNEKDDEIRIFPIYNRPHLTQSPRELWHRWSVTAGYHLRLAYYEPWMQTFRQQSTTSSTIVKMVQRLIITAAPFAVNCLLHISWWSIVVKGEPDFVYWILLFVYPLVGFGIQDVVAGLWTKGPNVASSKNVPRVHWLHRALNLLVLWTGFVLVGEPMSTAHGLNTDLTAVARSNLLLAPLRPQ